MKINGLLAHVLRRNGLNSTKDIRQAVRSGTIWGMKGFGPFTITELCRLYKLRIPKKPVRKSAQWPHNPILRKRVVSMRRRGFLFKEIAKKVGREVSVVAKMYHRWHYRV